MDSLTDIEKQSNDPNYAKPIQENSGITLVNTTEALNNLKNTQYNIRDQLTINKNEEKAYSVFTKHQKLIIIFIASISAFFSPLSSTIYYPSLELIRKDLNTTTTLVNLTITTYMIFQGISPLIWGNIADSIGRRPVYLITFLIYIITCICLANSDVIYSLIIFRMLQSFSSSSALSIGAGVIGDISTPSERGGFMGYFSMGTFMGQLIGPFLGGIIATFLNWRWVFWTLAIGASVLWIIQLFVLPETLRSLVGDGSGYANPTPTQYFRRIKATRRRIIDCRLQSAVHEKNYNQGNNIHRENNEGIKADSTKTKWIKILKSIISSLKYFKERDVFCILVFSALDFTGLQCMLSSITHFFEDIYGLNEFQVGLLFLSPGVGGLISSYGSGQILNWKFQQLTKSCGFENLSRNNLDPNFPIEEARLGHVWIYGLLNCFSMIFYGWSLYFKLHIAIPIILSFIISFCCASIFTISTTILVDIFPKNPSAVTAVCNIARFIISGVVILGVLPLSDAVGIGWMFTIIGLIILLSKITALVEIRYGKVWRLQRIENSTL